MNLFPKGFFNSSDKQSGSENKQKQDINNYFKGRTYRQYGDDECRLNAGDHRALFFCLSQIFAIFYENYIKDNKKQEELKKEYSIKLKGIGTDNENLQAQIDEIKNNKNPSIQKKINKSEEKIKDIKENPEQITHDRLSKIGFIIGAIIIFFLTCYLFVFYSSATYSALFKEFTRNDIGVASSIFDPQAIQKAYHAGIWELALIILAPFIFLALGFLIHKFVEHKELHFWPQFWSYVKVALLLIVTLSFDCIIAFKISKEIFKLEETLKSPLFDMGIALHDINFWTIIFAGFVVYVVWGLVFSFTMDEYEKLDAVQMAIKNEQKKINQWNEEVDSLNNEIDLKARQIQDNKKKIGELQEILSRGIIVYRDYERIHFEFMTGWMKCIEANAFGEDKKGLAEKASIDKLNEIKNKFEPINA